MIHALHCASSNWPLWLLLWLLLLWLLWLAACSACCCCSRPCTLGCDDSLGGLGAYWGGLAAYWCCCCWAPWAEDLHVLVEDHALVAAVFCTAHCTLGPRQT